jgi:hypothetical protein
VDGYLSSLMILLIGTKLNGIYNYGNSSIHKGACE